LSKLGDDNLVNRFLSKWKKKETETQPSISSKIKNIAKPPESVKDQINVVIQRLNLQIKSLDAAVQRFESRDAAIFQRVVKAMADRDQALANILATELGEIRKVEKMLTQASIALESVSMRLNTVSEVGDLVAVLAPAASVLNNIRTGMSTVLPQASQELESIGSLLGDIVTSSNQSTEMPMNIGTAANPEAEKILEEAELAAEKRLIEQFPEVATGVAISKKTSIEA
jgi:division protein CdvB (Snf7/Vps24/ESCRT-III family)